MITLLSPRTEITRPSGIRSERHLFLDMNDISRQTDGLQMPDNHHIVQLIDFAHAWDRSAPLLIHCWMGISRSTAAAFIIANALQADANPMDIALQLRQRSPSATPNARMVLLADEMLGRDGAMVRAVRHIGRGADAYEGTPFVLPLDFPSQSIS